tara:strand:- start:1399 stop:2400 length:1002 start_codon:yes stop_codon:yes gene_type:complete
MDTIRTNLINFGEKRGKPYAQSSITTYLRNIGKLYEKVGIEGPMSDMTWAYNPDIIEKALVSLKPTTQRNYYNALIIGLYATPSKEADEARGIYEGRREILNAEYDKNKGQPTEAQAKVLKEVNKDMILKMIVDTSKSDSRMDNLTNLLFLIHSNYPFRNEMAKIQVIQKEQYIKPAVNEERNNYLLIGKSGKGRRLQDHTLTFKLNDTKTYAKYGEKSIEVDDMPTKMALLKWIKQDITDDVNIVLPIPTYLFTWATGKPLMKNDISHLMSNFSNKHIGYSVSTTLMAKLFNEIPEGNTATKEEIDLIKKKAHIRGHTIKVSATIYNPTISI